MTEYDVIVVGAGNAAIAAAVAARQAGADSVAVLEKATPDMRGGNTHWSGALMRFAFCSGEDLKEIVPEAEAEFPGFFSNVEAYDSRAFLSDLVRSSSGLADLDLAKLLASNSYETLRWMHQDCGIGFEPAADLVSVKSEGKIKWPKGAVIRVRHEGPGLSSGWFNCASQHRIDILYSTAMTDLLHRDGRIAGVICRTDDGEIELSAPAVILACGGFEANAQMRAQYLGAPWDQARVRGTPHNQGDGLRAALAAGAMPWGNWTGCHATPISADWGRYAPREMTDKSNRLSYTYGVMLNRAGARFVDEGENFKFHTYARFGREILAQPGALAYQIFDQTALPHLEGRYATSEPITADTLESLMDKLDIDDRAAAMATLDAYNAAARDPDGFDPTRLDGLATQGLSPNKTNWAFRIEKGPFVAYTATAGITFSFGGVKADEFGRVIGTDWRPIPGLYACGEMVGGLFHGNYVGGSGLTAGALMGRIAGSHAAGQPLPVRTEDFGDDTMEASPELQWVP